jgi:hypothetical protein
VASCSQIASKVQAFVDGELSQSQRLICGQHFAECRSCRSALQEHQQLTASLFEMFADYRLSSDLSVRVLENLPMRLERDKDDLEGLNWRAKHPQETIRWIARYMPVAAAVVILVLAAIIRFQWPQEVFANDAIGVVLQNYGHSTVVSGVSGTERKTTSVSDFILANDRFETDETGALLLALAGQTKITMNARSRVTVENERLVRLEDGEAFLDVGHDDRLFKVRTALGTVTVFGTKFSVFVSENVMKVTVASGTVQLDSNDGHFQPLQAGEQAVIIGKSAPSMPERVDVDGMLRWVAMVKENMRALHLFEKEIASRRNGNSELPGKAVWMVDVSKVQTGISAIRLEWTAGNNYTEYCGYELYVYNEYMKPLFAYKVTPEELRAARNGILTVDVPGKPISGASVLIRLVPDIQDGREEVRFTNVWAVPF